MPMIRTLLPPAARRSVMISVRLATAVGRVASTQASSALRLVRTTQELRSLAPMSIVISETRPG